MFADIKLTTVNCLNMDAGLYVLPHGIRILKKNWAIVLLHYFLYIDVVIGLPPNKCTNT